MVHPPLPNRVSGISSRSALAGSVSDGLFIWLAATLAFVASVLCFTPRYYCWEFSADLANVAEVSRAMYTRQQLVEPWALIHHPAHRVQEWRLLFPYLVYVLHLPRVVYYAFPFVGALCTTALAVGIVLDRTRSRTLAAATGGLMATSAWFFVSVGFLAYFDSWVLFFLMLAVFRAGPWSLMACVALGSFIDERMLIALPMIWGLRRANFGPMRSDAKDDTIALILGALPYVVFRGGYILAYRETSVNDYLANENFSTRSLLQMLSGAWHGLRTGWLPIVGLLLGPGLVARGSLAVGLAITLTASISVAGDYSRSAAMLSPAVLAGVIFLGKGQPKMIPRLAMAALALNLIIPAKHVFAIGHTFLRPVNEIEREADAFEESRRSNPKANIRVDILGSPTKPIHPVSGST